MLKLTIYQRHRSREHYKLELYEHMTEVHSYMITKFFYGIELSIIYMKQNLRVELKLLLTEFHNHGNEMVNEISS